MTVHASRTVEVRALRHGDVAFAAELHRRALLPGFFSQLGCCFLRAYYESFATSPHAVAFVATGGGSPLGVLVGTLDTPAHYAWVLRHRGGRLGLRGAGALLGRPGVAAYFLRTRATRYLRRLVGSLGATAAANGGGRPERVAVLTHVAVDEVARSRGTGAKLVAAFVAAARAAGADRAALVTAAGPEGAGGFYERLGWAHGGDRRDRDGRYISDYALPLRETA